GPLGVCSLLGRAGEARSGSCREVQRRHAEISTAISTRRLTSRQVPDCLRCPAEERTHPRPHHPPPQPAPPTPAPNRPRPLSEEGPASGELDLDVEGDTGAWRCRRGFPQSASDTSD